MKDLLYDWRNWFGNHSSIIWNLLYKEDSKVTSQIVQFYQTLYQETKVQLPMAENFEFQQIEGLDRGWLER